MNEKLNRIETIHAILDSDSVKEGTPAYDADKDFQKKVTKDAIITLARYRQTTPDIHWTENQEKNAIIGFSGQIAFEELLKCLKIPYDTDEPTERIRKPFDFKLSTGTIEVKSYDYYCYKVLIKESEWKHNDFLVVWQYTDDTHNRIIFKGWLTKKEVESHGVTLKGKTKYNPHSDSYVIDFSELHPPKTAKFLT